MFKKDNAFPIILIKEVSMMAKKKAKKSSKKKGAKRR